MIWMRAILGNLRVALSDEARRLAFNPSVTDLSLKPKYDRQNSQPAPNRKQSSGGHNHCVDLAARSLHLFAFSPISTRRRMASERLSSRASPHASTSAVISAGRRTALTGFTHQDFRGRPRDFMFTEIGFFIFLVYRKCEPRGSGNFRP
jgi:hypothetical protein